MRKALLRKLERLARELSPPPEDDLLAPLWCSQWLAGFCAAADADMGRAQQWHHYPPPWLHHWEELRGWYWCTLEAYCDWRGGLPAREAIKRWIDAGRLAAAPWVGLETWPPPV